MYDNNQQTTIEHYARDLIAKSVAMIVVLRCYLRKFAPSSAPARKSTKDPDAGLAQEQKQPQQQQVNKCHTLRNCLPALRKCVRCVRWRDTGRKGHMYMMKNMSRQHCAVVLSLIISLRSLCVLYDCSVFGLCAVCHKNRHT